MSMSAGAHELELYIDNDGDLYRQQGQPILKNLATKKATGAYDHDKAVKLYMYFAEAGAKKYAKEFGDEKDWSKMFPVSDRKQVAEASAKSFETEYALGNYDNLLPKKCQPKAPAAKRSAAPKRPTAKRSR